MAKAQSQAKKSQTQKDKKSLKNTPDNVDFPTSAELKHAQSVISKFDKVKTRHVFYFTATVTY